MSTREKKDRIIMFGASSAGINFINKYEDKYKIMCIADNDIKKHNTTLYGFPVIEPARINNYQYDFIIITSSFLLQIKEQLVTELGIDPHKIKAIPKGTLYASKSWRPFEDEKTIELARHSLLFLVDMFEAHNITYFIDHGTLLGIVRDGDIIPWDDDIDLTVDVRQIERVIECIASNITNFPLYEDLRWVANIKYNQESKPCSITIKFDNEKVPIKKFPISITGFFLKDGLAIQNVTYAPEHYFKKREYILYKNRKVAVPYQYESYLTYHYGNWKEPKKDISFLDILNYKEADIKYTEEL